MQNTDIEQVNHLIVGAGISGMFIAMQLQQQNQRSFMIVESSAKPHTKLESTTIKTQDQEQIVEMGASTFHSNQANLINMIQYFDLQNNIALLQTSKKYCFAPDIYTQNDQNISDYLQTRFEQIKMKVNEASKWYENKFLTIDQLARQQLNDLEYAILYTCWDCWYENKDMNAHTFFKDQQGLYMYLKNGLKTLLKTAWKQFDLHLVNNFRAVDVRQFDQQYLVTFQSSVKNEQIFKQVLTNKLYVCIGLEHLSSINWNEFTAPMKLYTSLGKSVSSMRFFLILKDDFSLPFKQTIGTIIGHWWIQLSSKIIMIYTDDQSADDLNALSDQQIVDTFQQQLQAVYDIQVNVSSILSRCIRAYWPNAFEVLLPAYYQQTKSINKILPFTITSLPHPQDQAWMNGHLYDIKQV